MTSPHAAAFFVPGQPPPPFAPAPEDDALKQRIDTLCGYFAKNGPTFVHTMAARQGGNPEFGFLHGGPGAQYYSWALLCILHGLPATEPLPGQAQATPVVAGLPQVAPPAVASPAAAPAAPATAAAVDSTLTAAVLQGLPAEVSSGWQVVLGLLSGSRDSIRNSQQWFMACAPYAAGMAEMMLQHQLLLADYQRQLHVVYLANDILFKALSTRPEGTAPDADAIAQAFRPRLGRMLRSAFVAGGQGAEVHQNLLRVVNFWGERGVYDRAAVELLTMEMMGQPLPAGAATASLAAAAHTPAPAPAVAAVAAQPTAAAAARPWATAAAVPVPEQPVAQQPWAQQAAPPGAAAAAAAQYPGAPTQYAAAAASSAYPGPPPADSYYAGGAPGPDPQQQQPPYGLQQEASYGHPGSAAQQGDAPGAAGYGQHHQQQGGYAGQGYQQQQYHQQPHGQGHGQYPHAQHQHQQYPPHDQHQQQHPPHGQQYPGMAHPQHGYGAPPPEPVPFDPMSFPPGLIPKLVEDKLKTDPPYSPLSPLDIQNMGVAPPPQEDAYLKARVDKMLAQLTDYRPGMLFSDIEVEAPRTKQFSDNAAPLPPAPPSISDFLPHAGLGLGAGPPGGGRYEDGSYAGLGMGRGGTGLGFANAREEEQKQREQAATAAAAAAAAAAVAALNAAAAAGKGGQPGQAGQQPETEESLAAAAAAEAARAGLTETDLSSFRYMRSKGYHQMIVQNAAKKFSRK